LSDPTDPLSELITEQDSTGTAQTSGVAAPEAGPSQQPINEISDLNHPNFCSRCGAAWQTNWTRCMVCIQRGEALVLAYSAKPASSSIGLALGLYFALLAANGIGILVDLSHLKNSTVMIGTEIADCLIIAIAAAICWRKIADGFLKPFALRWLVIAPLTAIGTFLLASLVLVFEHNVLGFEELSVSKDFFQDGYGWLAVILAVCVQPALFEETAFRGIILGSLQPTLNVRDAVVVSALLFMTLHLEIMGIPYLFVLGLVLGYFRVKSGSLIPGMIVHFTHNLLCVIFEQFHWGVR